jgi:hypothetical protein
MAKRAQAEENNLQVALAQIGPGNPEAKAAARLLNRTANGNWTLSRKEWFTHPDRIDSLLRAIPHATPNVAVDIIGTLGALSQRYECLDPRIHSTLLHAFASAPDPVKLAIAQAIPQYGTPEAWDAVLATLAAKPPKAAQHTVGLAASRYGTSIPARLKPVFAERLLVTAASQTNRDVLGTLIKGIGAVGSSANVTALRTLLETVDSQTLREYILSAIANCEKRSP